MEYAWIWLYVWTRLDLLIDFAIAIMVASTLALVVAAVFRLPPTSQEQIETARKIVNRSGPVLALSVLLILLVPSKSDLAIILGGHFAGQAVVSDEMNETTAKVYELIHKELDERLVEDGATEQ